MELLLFALVLLLAYVAILRLQMSAQQREFLEFKKNVVIVPVARKKPSTWIALFAVSTFLLAVAVIILINR